MNKIARINLTFFILAIFGLLYSLYTFKQGGGCGLGFGAHFNVMPLLILLSIPNFILAIKNFRKKNDIAQGKLAIRMVSFNLATGAMSVLIAFLAYFITSICF